MKRLLLSLPLLLAACGQPDSDAGPGGVTQGEARALDEAAAMLDERPKAPATATTAQPATPAATDQPE